MTKQNKKPNKYYRPNNSANSRALERQVNITRKVILAVIFIAMLTVVIAVLCSFFLNTETRVKSDITNLASEYYEEYFYKNLIDSTQFKKNNNLDSTMKKYHEYGLSPIRLSDLLLYDNEKNADHREFLTEYCDENATIIKFYPEPPYNKQDYRIEIDYACNF